MRADKSFMSTGTSRTLNFTAATERLKAYCACVCGGCGPPMKLRCGLVGVRVISYGYTETSMESTTLNICVTVHRCTLQMEQTF
jgi:hypothetical protein